MSYINWYMTTPQINLEKELCEYQKKLAEVKMKALLAIERCDDNLYGELDTIMFDTKEIIKKLKKERKELI